MKAFDFASGALETKRFEGADTAKDIAQWMSRNFTSPHFAAYESGCAGFHLCRNMRALGVDCDVIAVSSIPRSSEDKINKTDKRDAAHLLSELLNPTHPLSRVWVPDEQCEAARDVARARADAVGALKRTKQQTGALLMRHGVVWDRRTESGKLKATWTEEYRAWLSHVDLGEPAACAALRFYLHCVDDAIERVRDIEQTVAPLARSERFKPYVDALSTMKGISAQSAFLLACEFGDFERFVSGRGVSKWMGLVPSEASSGELVSHGHIIKAGNVYVRGVLVEDVNTVNLRAFSSKRLGKDQVVEPHVLSLCRKADRRILSRFDSLKKAKVPANKRKVALAHEMARWVWIVGREVERSRS